MSRSTSLRVAVRNSIRCTPGFRPSNRMTWPAPSRKVRVRSRRPADEQLCLTTWPQGFDGHLARARVRIVSELKRNGFDDRLEAQHVAQRIHAIDVDVIKEHIVAALGFELEPDAEVGYHVDFVGDLLDVARPLIRAGRIEIASVVRSRR